MIEVLRAGEEAGWESCDWPPSGESDVPPLGIIGGSTRTDGWLAAIRVDGAVFYGHDHYYVDEDDVIVWSDDPDDDPYELGFARAWSRSSKTSRVVAVPSVPDSLVRHGIWLSDDAWLAIKRDLGLVYCMCRG